MWPHGPQSIQSFRPLSPSAGKASLRLGSNQRSVRLPRRDSARKTRAPRANPQECGPMGRSQSSRSDHFRRRRERLPSDWVRTSEAVRLPRRDSARNASAASEPAGMWPHGPQSIQSFRPLSPSTGKASLRLGSNQRSGSPTPARQRTQGGSGVPPLVSNLKRRDAASTLFLHPEVKHRHRVSLAGGIFLLRGSDRDGVVGARQIFCEHDGARILRPLLKRW